MSQTGRHAEALPHLEEALKLREEISGGDSFHLVPLLHLLSFASLLLSLRRVLLKRERSAEADAALRRALPIAQTYSGPWDNASVYELWTVCMHLPPRA